MQKIPLYKPSLGEEEIEAARKVIKSGVLTRGNETERFENEFASYTGKKYAIAVSSGTSGLHLSVRALGWKDGDEVITTPYSFIVTSNALLFQNVTPVFIDIDPRTLNIDTKKIEEKIDEKTVGFLLVHIWGLPVDVSGMQQIKNKYNLKIIEDSCQAFLKPSDDFPVSQIGELSVYSFFENKPMTSGGEGGMIVTDNLELAESCRSLRDQGRSSAQNWLDHVNLGYNYRMTEIQAAIGRIQLNKLPTFLSRRKEISEKYNKLLKEVPQVKIPFVDPNLQRSWFLYYIIFESSEIRDKVQSFLSVNGIESKTYFPPIPSFHEFKIRGYDVNQFPNAKRIYETSLALPLFYSLEDSQVEFIVNKIKESINDK